MLNSRVRCTCNRNACNKPLLCFIVSIGCKAVNFQNEWVIVKYVLHAILRNDNLIDR